MSYVMRASELMGLPVVSILDGEDVAEVRDVVYDSQAHRLLGFTLNKRGLFSGRLKDVLPANAVSAIGADAVMERVALGGCSSLRVDSGAPGVRCWPCADEGLSTVRSCLGSPRPRAAD